jgi:hypothetical protein
MSLSPKGTSMLTTIVGRQPSAMILCHMVRDWDRVASPMGLEILTDRDRWVCGGQFTLVGFNVRGTRGGAALTRARSRNIATLLLWSSVRKGLSPGAGIIIRMARSGRQRMSITIRGDLRPHAARMGPELWIFNAMTMTLRSIGTGH